MKISLTEDKKFLKIDSTDMHEINQLRSSFTKELPNAFILKKINPWINTKRCFMNNYGLIPVGCWMHLLETAKKYSLPCEISDDAKEYMKGYSLDKEKFTQYIQNTFRGAQTESGTKFMPYDYQIEAAYKLLKFRKCSGEIATSSGKTLISFMMFKYLLDVEKEKFILYIVPSVDLAKQSAEKYELYESYLKVHSHNWEIGILRAGLTKEEKAKVESCNILFGTFQSLCKKKSDFFDKFTVHIGDECHHYVGSNSLKNILDKCHNLKWSFGMTGTYPQSGTYGNLMLQSLLGPVVYKFTTDQLIHTEKTGTPIYVIFEILDYFSYSDKEFMYNMRANKDPEDIGAGVKALKEEEKLINASYTRLKYIGDMAVKTKNNTLVLFGDIKGGYGKSLADYIKDNSDKNVYYCDGGTPADNREYFKTQMENDLEGKTVLVASIGTMGEGIDIKNLWNIFLVNTAKSERIIRQICGRGLRMFPGKDKTLIFDFVDDLRFSPKEAYSTYYKENYMWKHYKDREKIYKGQNFPMFKKNVKFN